MHTKTATRTSLFTLALFLVTGTLFAGKKDKELNLQIEGENGTEISLSISADFVDGILEGLAGPSMDCDVTTDEDIRAMLEHLDRRGEGSKYKFRDDDGKLIQAKRRRGQFHLDISKRGEQDVHVSLPWAVGQCMLGRRVDVSTDGRAEFSVEDDGAIRVTIQ